MEKRIIILILFLFLIYPVFSDGGINIDAPFKKPIGETLEEVIKNLGEPLVLNKYQEVNVYNITIIHYTLFYEGFQIFIQHLVEY